MEQSCKSIKIIIIGNSASGKTTLSNIIQKKINIDFCLFHLDNFFWKDKCLKKRNKSIYIVEKLLLESINCENWIIEGVYSNIMYFFIKKANILIWLDTEQSICISRIQNRIHLIKDKTQCDPKHLLKRYQKMLETSKKYYNSTGNKSKFMHQKLFKNFNHKKFLVQNNSDYYNIIDYLDKFNVNKPLEDE